MDKPKHGGNRYIAMNENYITTRDVMQLLKLTYPRFTKLTRILGIKPVCTGIWSKDLIERIQNIHKNFMDEKGHIDWDTFRAAYAGRKIKGVD